MKKAKKALLLVLCALLLVGASIAGTVAYLTAQDSVENTFTAGNVTIELKENKIDPATGALVDSDPNQEGIQTTYEAAGIENIKVVPGRAIQKQPVVIVEENSENCWLFVKVEGDVLAAGEFTVTEGWTAVAGQAGWYQKTDVATVGSYQVFEKFTFGDLDNAAVEALEDGAIVVTAYAIQAEGVEQSTAFATAKGMTTP